MLMCDEMKFKFSSTTKLHVIGDEISELSLLFGLRYHSTVDGKNNITSTLLH